MREYDMKFRNSKERLLLRVIKVREVRKKKENDINPQQTRNILMHLVFIIL